MASKSDKRRERRISATEASRSFSRILDQVESGRRFVIHRRGHDVGLLSPPPTLGRRGSECLALLRGRTPTLLDDGFAEDLLDAIAADRAEERPAWDS